MAKKMKIIGLSVGITVVMFIFLVLFIRALGVLLNDFFTAYALWILIISGFFLVVGIISGSITIGSMLSKGKGLV